MNTSELIFQIDAEISRLQKVRELLGGTDKYRVVKGGRLVKKRTLSAAARAKIAEAQRKRWAKQKKAK